MLKHSEKTVPYKLSQAELENLRLLRKRMNPSGSNQDDDEEQSLGEKDASSSNPDRFSQNVEKKIP